MCREGAKSTEEDFVARFVGAILEGDSDTLDTCVLHRRFIFYECYVKHA